MKTRPNFDKCVKYALKMKGINGDSFKDTNLRVFERHTANPGTVFTSLRKDGIVIPIVNATLFGKADKEMTATIAIGANQITDMVSLYVPEANDIKQFPIDRFVEAWEQAGGFCTTAFPDDPSTYTPLLKDLRQVELPDGIDALREALAENSHDRWAIERQSEGWTYGPERDDAKLESPDMVPYDQLPESEKQYDRLMAVNTLKLLISLGYKIEKNG